jgi:hypothetical protein
MATMLEDFTIKEQRSIIRFFCGQRDSMQRTVLKECFLFTAINTIETTANNLRVLAVIIQFTVPVRRGEVQGGIYEQNKCAWLL